MFLKLDMNAFGSNIATIVSSIYIKNIFFANLKKITEI